MPCPVIETTIVGISVAINVGFWSSEVLVIHGPFLKAFWIVRHGGMMRNVELRLLSNCKVMCYKGCVKAQIVTERNNRR